MTMVSESFSSLFSFDGSGTLPASIYSLVHSLYWEVGMQSSISCVTCILSLGFTFILTNLRLIGVVVRESGLVCIVIVGSFGAGMDTLISIVRVTVEIVATLVSCGLPGGEVMSIPMGDGETTVVTYLTVAIII